MFELNITKQIRSIIRYTRNFNIDKKNVCGSRGSSLPTNLDPQERAFICIIIFVIIFMNTIVDLNKLFSKQSNVRDFFNTSTVGLQISQHQISGRFSLRTILRNRFFILFLGLIYQEFCVPDPDDLLLPQNTVQLSILFHLTGKSENFLKVIISPKIYFLWVLFNSNTC